MRNRRIFLAKKLPSALQDMAEQIAARPSRWVPGGKVIGAESNGRQMIERAGLRQQAATGGQKIMSLVGILREVRVFAGEGNMHALAFPGGTVKTTDVAPKTLVFVSAGMSIMRRRKNKMPKGRRGPRSHLHTRNCCNSISHVRLNREPAARDSFTLTKGGTFCRSRDQGRRRGQRYGGRQGEKYAARLR